MKKPGLVFVFLILLVFPSFSQAKNVITIDINPELAAVFFNSSGVKGLGFGLGYERVLIKNVSVGADVKSIFLTYPAYDARFSSIHIALHGRYYAFSAPGKLFFDFGLGGMYHRSPFQKSFMLSFGAAIGWKFIIKGHFVIEPYIGWTVFSGDKFLAPWSITALTEILIPGFCIGIPIGWSF